MSDALTEPGCSYRIRIKGHLDARWARWFVGLRAHGLEISQMPEGDTLLSGSGIDQAALHGILDRIRDLGLELISVQRDPEPPATVTGETESC